MTMQVASREQSTEGFPPRGSLVLFRQHEEGGEEPLNCSADNMKTQPHTPFSRTNNNSQRPCSLNTLRKEKHFPSSITHKNFPSLSLKLPFKLLGRMVFSLFHSSALGYLGPTCGQLDFPTTEPFIRRSKGLAQTLKL